MGTVRYEEMNTRSFEEGKFDKAIVPLGSCESHGDHLPFGMDALVAHKLALEVGRRVPNTMVLPPTWFGMSLRYRHKPMTITLTNDTNIRVIEDILDSLVYWGIKKVLIVNGHDDNIPCLDVASRNAKIKHPEMKIAALDAWWVTAGQLLPPDTFEVWGGLGHGGEGETSIGLALVPELVDISRARGMIPTTDPNVKQFWTFDELTRFGATGAPAKATLEKGEKMKAALVDCLVDFLQRMDRQDWAYPSVEA
jgi:creatinine amidohydrolase